VAIERVGTLERAVENAARTAGAGDIVLLAPACASFDQFENYEHRGRTFKELVRQVEARCAPVTGSNAIASGAANESAAMPGRFSKGR
jgi:hypothetical protein